MSEKVTINGVSGGLKEWASEETLGDILKVLKDIGKISERQKKDIMSKRSGGIDSDINDSLDDIAKSISDLEKETEEQTKATKKGTKQQNEKIKALKTATKTVLKFSAGIAGISGKLVGMAVSQMNTSVELARSGAQLTSEIEGISSGMGAFGHAIKTANLSIGEMSSLTKTHAAVINQYGIQTFANLSNSMTRDLRDIGMTASEGAEMLAEYLDMQRMMGVRERLDDIQQRRQNEEALRSVERWSKALGQSREEILKGTRAAMEQDYVQSAINSLMEGGTEVSNAFREVASSLNAKGASGLQQQLLGAIAQPYSAVASELYATASRFSPQAAQIMADMSNAVNAGDIESANKMVTQFLEEMSDTGAIKRARSAMDTEFIAMANQARIVHRMHTEQSEAVYDSAEAMAQFRDSVKPITHFLQRVMLGVVGSDKFTNAISNLSDKFDELVNNGTLDKLTDSATSLLISFADGLVPTVTKFVSWLDKLITGDGLDSKKIAKDVGSFLGSVIMNLPWGTIALVAGSALATAMAAGFALKGGVGKGIGDMVGGAVGGIAKGIVAGLRGLVSVLVMAGTPKTALMVAAGGAAIGTAIAAIGYGVSKSVQWVGSALPDLMEGLQGFNELDGENLKSVGLGLAGVGLGLGALTASKVVNGITNFASKALGAITGGRLGGSGDKNAFSFLEDLSDMELNSDHIVNMAQALDRLSESLDKFNSLNLNDLNIEKTQSLIGSISQPTEKRSTNRWNPFSSNSRQVETRDVNSAADKIEETTRTIERQSSNQSNLNLDSINTLIREQNELIGILISGNEDNGRHLKTLIRRIESR